MLRKRFNIPDNFSKDTHLGNWMRKNFTSECEAVFIRDKEDRGTLTRKGSCFHHTEILCCMQNGNVVSMTTSENMFINKR